MVGDGSALTDSEIDEKLAEVPRIQFNAWLWASKICYEKVDFSNLTHQQILEKVKRLQKGIRYRQALRNVLEIIDDCLVKMDQCERASKVLVKRKDWAKVTKYAERHKYYRLKLVKWRTKLALIYLKRERERRKVEQNLIRLLREQNKLSSKTKEAETKAK